MILLAFLGICMAQENYLDQNNQFQLSWPVQSSQNEDILRAVQNVPRQQFNGFRPGIPQNGALFSQQPFHTHNHFGQHTLIPNQQGLHVQHTSIANQGVFGQQGITNHQSFSQHSTQTHFFPSHLGVKSDFPHLGSIQNYHSSETEEGNLPNFTDMEDVPDFLLGETHFPERRNFETDVDSQPFDPFHQREAVMDFLDHHQIRQTPLVFHGEGVLADPHHHHHQHHHHHHHHHRGDYPQNDDKKGGKQEQTGAPYLLNVPIYRDFEYNRDVEETSNDANLQEILGNQRRIVDAIKQNNDSDLQLIGNIGDGILTDLESKFRTKRSVPLVRLMNDPNVRLDVPKTVQNFGAVTKNSLDDDKTPIYHVKNLLGSSKNTLLSALRIPPQNLIIPSDYEIVRSDRLGAINPDLVREQDDSEQTFQKMGQMVRDSIKSGQDTANHIADMAYNTRNILHTSKHAIPRIIVPYSQTPALKRDKIVLVSPRIVDVSENRLGQSNPNLMKLGQIMDAVGLSNPNPEKPKLEKIILRQKYKNQKEDPSVGQTLFTLENVKTSLGAKNLREFLRKMRKAFKNVLRHAFGEEPKKKIDEDKEVNKFLEDLFDQPEQERVGAGLYLAPDLYKPFMGRATPVQLNDYLRENGDVLVSSRPPQNPSITLDPGTMEDFLQFLKAKQDAHLHQFRKSDKNDTNQDLGYVLGAINPLMFERNYNETLVVNNNTMETPHHLFTKKNDTVGLSMTISGPALKPFMGQARPTSVQDFMDSYNQERDYNYVENDFEPDYSD